MKFNFLGRLARAENAIGAAAVMAILASVGVFALIGGGDAAAGPVVCLIAVLVSMPYHRRRVERMRRCKEILNHHSPDPNARPLGV
jgi:hypothetical protein